MCPLGPFLLAWSHIDSATIATIIVTGMYVCKCCFKFNNCYVYVAILYLYDACYLQASIYTKVKLAGFCHYLILKQYAFI